MTLLAWLLPLLLGLVVGYISGRLHERWTQQDREEAIWYQWMERELKK
jgi:hypothetical protein